MLAIIIAVLAAATCLTIILIIHHLLTIERRYLNWRMQQFVRQNEKNERIKISWKELLTWASKVFETRGAAKKFEKDLIKAGIPLKGEEFLTLNILAGLASGVIMFLASQDILKTIPFAILGFLLPRILLNARIKKRVKRLENQIGDALTVMANSMRAGFSFLQAMETISKEMPDPIAGEFKKTLREISLGTPTQKAMLAMSERIGSEDLDLVITAILIQRQVGGNLAEVLDKISETIRERLRIKAEIKTLTAQGRISGIVIGSMPSVLGVVLFVINADYIMTLFTHNIGIMLVVAGVISQIIGFILIRKVIQIEV
ncbi:MAG: tight adherence protein [Clostridia bacterium]|nr:tight adherence protein [Clostridiales bacterium]MDK2985669.1 tight adherence protein [Clostridia bacterium]